MTKEIKKNPHSTLYTIKEVEVINLLHKINKIIEPTTLIEKVREWYHSILVHLSNDHMEDSIRSLYT